MVQRRVFGELRPALPAEIRRRRMLSERERQELVGSGGQGVSDCSSPDDPIFASVVMSERVLEHAARAVAQHLARNIEASFAAHEEKVVCRVGEAVNAELHRLIVARGRARAELQKSGRRWTTTLAAIAILGLDRGLLFNGRGRERRADLRTDPAANTSRPGRSGLVSVS